MMVGGKPVPPPQPAIKIARVRLGKSLELNIECEADGSEKNCNAHILFQSLQAVKVKGMVWVV